MLGHLLGFGGGSVGEALRQVGLSQAAGQVSVPVLAPQGGVGPSGAGNGHGNQHEIEQLVGGLVEKATEATAGRIGSVGACSTALRAGRSRGGGVIFPAVPGSPGRSPPRSFVFPGALLTHPLEVTAEELGGVSAGVALERAAAALPSGLAPAL